MSFRHIPVRHGRFAIWASLPYADSPYAILPYDAHVRGRQNKDNNKDNDGDHRDNDCDDDDDNFIAYLT